MDFLASWNKHLNVLMGKNKIVGFSGFRRLPLPFYSFLEELVEKSMETNKNIIRMDDLLIVMMLASIRKCIEMLHFEWIPTQREQFYCYPIPLFISTLGFQDQQPKSLSNFRKTAWRSQYQGKQVDVLLTLNISFS